MIGIAPRSAVLGSSIYTSYGFYGYVANKSFSTIYGQDGTSARALDEKPWPSELPDNSVIHVKFERESSFLKFSVDDGASVPATFLSPIPAGVDYCPAVNVHSAGKALKVRTIATPRCPLEVLLSVAMLGKKYMVKSIVSMTMQVLKTRLAEAKCNDAIDAFQQVLAGTSAHDLCAVRMAALDCAKDFAKLRAAYDAGELKPEAANQLEAIWSPAPGAANKLRGARLV